MRLREKLLFASVLLLASNANAASVLVPGETKSQTPTQATHSNMGLVPTQQPSQSISPLSSTATAITMPQQQALSQTANTSAGMDKVDLNLVTDAQINEIRQGLPKDMAGLNNNDIKKILEYSANKLNKDNFAKYVKTDPKTGKPTVDVVALNKDAEAKEKKSVSITPGGKVEPKSITREEAVMAKYQIRTTGKALDPRVEKAMAAAKLHREEMKKQNARAPIMINDLNMEPLDLPMLTSTIKIGVAKEYVWGEKAANMIIKAMGYERDDIPKNCQLRLNIYLNTDEEPKSFRIALFSNTLSDLKYSGKIQSISTKPVAVCQPPKTPLPSNGSIIFKVADKYGVPLSEAMCSPPPKENKNDTSNPTSVVIAYTDDQTIQCLFK